MMANLSKKVCLLGDFAVGKTSLVRRFVYNRFDDKYLSTIGVKVSRKTVSVPHNNQIVPLTLMLWDLAGSEEFSAMRASYLRGAAGGILVCDLTRPETLNNLFSYVEDLLRLNPAARLILAANKQDLADQHFLSETEVADVADQLDTTYYLTSAKTGTDVETLFRQLGQFLI
jgi:small GTP-binding protein